MALQQARMTSAADILRSVGVVVLVVLAVVLLAPRRHYDAVKEIDYSGDLSSARAVAPYHVLAPEGLPSGWRATSVRYATTDGAVMWHLGYLSPGGEYLGVEQSNGPSDVWIRLQSHNGKPEGTMLIDGELWWKRYEPSGKLRSLSTIEGAVTTVVGGIASYETLAEFAAALR